MSGCAASWQPARSRLQPDPTPRDCGSCRCLRCGSGRRASKRLHGASAAGCFQRSGAFPGSRKLCLWIARGLGSEPLRAESSSKRTVLRGEAWTISTATLSERSLMLNHRLDDRWAQVRVTSNPDGLTINVDRSGSALLLSRHMEGSDQMPRAPRDMCDLGQPVQSSGCQRADLRHHR